MHADVAFVHSPSIYDFRKRELREGPISDVVPSTPLFEMYPVGFVSMLSYLMKNGYSGRICNLAVLMLDSDRFDVERYLRNVDADIYGLDLHWMPHVHGTLEIAKLIRSIHPDGKIVLGGFSASYFANEIMREVPQIDFILKGDFMEKPLVQLVDAVQYNKPIEGIRSLVYRKDGTIKENAPSGESNPSSDVFIDYSVLVRSSIRYHDIKGHLPYLSWIKNPVGMTVIQHGCQYNCGFCGGSNFAYKNNYYASGLVRRDPERVAEEIEVIADTIASPVFIAGDIAQTGTRYYSKLFNEIKGRGIDLPLLTEYFVPPGEEYFKTLSAYFSQFMCEISPDSMDQTIRERTGRSYDNFSLSRSVEMAANYGSKKFDIYLSIGLPGQTKDDVLMDADMLERFITDHTKQSMPVYGFMSPLTPFLDPGSLFYQFPEKYGYTVKTRRLMDFYNLLDKGRSWEDFLNYETQWMTKEEMVQATYLASIKMVQLASSLGYVVKEEKERIVNNIMDYMNGKDYISQSDKSRHLTYLVKELDWSRKHALTFVSTAVFAYSLYTRIRGLINGR